MPPADTTLRQITDENVCDFGHSAAVFKWLDGLWLEHHTLAEINSCALAAKLNRDGIAMNVETLSKEGRRFEADVVALKGYQLFYFSCYSGSDESQAKSKLFEAVERASQLGGDEARAALVCCADDYPDNDRAAKLRKECESDWLYKTQNQIKVFGRSALPDLATKLTNWFTRRS